MVLQVYLLVYRCWSYSIHHILLWLYRSCDKECLLPFMRILNSSLFIIRCLCRCIYYQKQFLLSASYYHGNCFQGAAAIIYKSPTLYCLRRGIDIFNSQVVNLVISLKFEVHLIGKLGICRFYFF